MWCFVERGTREVSGNAVCIWCYFYSIIVFLLFSFFKKHAEMSDDIVFPFHVEQRYKDTKTMIPLEKRRKKTRRERRLEKRRLERSGAKEEKKMSGDDEGKIQKDKERERPSDAKIELDGGEGEGGGQILRIAFASAFLTKQAISIRSIRKNRSTPGFRAQHLAGANLIQTLCGATFVGGQVKSTSCTFIPASSYPDLPKEIVVDPKTAGAISLIIQIALPCVLYLPKPVTLRIRGGTDVNFSPPMDYVSNVLLQALFGRDQHKIKLRLRRRGFYPRGGGEILLSATPASSPMNPIRMYRRGRVKSVRAFVVVWGPDDEERKEYAKSIEVTLKDMCSKHKNLNSLKQVQISFGVTRKTKKKRFPTCFTINIVAYTETGCVLASNITDEKASKDRSIEKRVELSCQNLLKRFETDVLMSGACCDEHLADQLLIFMALARGVSVIRYPSEMSSKHFSTAIDVLKKMMPSVCFEIVEISSMTASSLSRALHITDEHKQKDLISLHRDIIDSVDVDKSSRRDGSKLLICHGVGR